jgi:hypothetical protein
MLTRHTAAPTCTQIHTRAYAPAQECPPLVSFALEGGCVGVGVGKELQRAHVRVQRICGVLVVASDAQVPAVRHSTYSSTYVQSELGLQRARCASQLRILHPSSYQPSYDATHPVCESACMHNNSAKGALIHCCRSQIRRFANSDV